ncbi:PTS sugar transporter subunit IIA [Defluviitalea raffinosedens]|uniref:PTS glucose transporter subunit IIA n=1 Tax=Defluviitalea raffinosedens TaxID=1450156 RepID=A0A7C8LHW9_9FIRM|nr:PTS glucose transporter subunit IIA [Defluviitalea raffinosedens]KAE9635664.1 PTS glucose transporter subunit IIA [Defluviitalea raffinosedens]MBM7684590.1 PTS system glucose-specific IIA component [Defluviitalea raffinosedens]HHW68309.1 PTS glucose transporter subunit IIA [Candidatus Epulonipiscium sp.]
MFGFLKKSIEVYIVAPVSGKLMDITEVPDEVFSAKMVGDGVAIEPNNGLVVAPCNGTIVQIFNTNHAVAMKTKEGLEILIHLGIDTVKLKGEGFRRIAAVGDEVKEGDPLIEMDLETIKSLGKSTITPIIITNPQITEAMEKKNGIVEAGKDNIMVIKIKR